MKPYHSHIEETDITYFETTNNLAEIPVDKPANEEILMPIYHSNFQKLCQQGRSWKSHFTNNLMDKAIDILICHKKCADYKLALKLRHNKIIISFGDFFKKFNLTEIKFLLANSVIQPLQYDFNKHAGVSLFKSHFIQKIKGKTTDKS